MVIPLGKSFLLNTPSRIADVAALRGDWLVVAEKRGAVPLAWLCLFSDADLRPCTISFLRSEMVAGRSRKLLTRLAILNPCVSVKDAKVRLAAAQPLFTRLASNPETGARQWREAVRSLDDLPLGYLTLDATALLVAGGAKAMAATLAAALSPGDAAIAARCTLAKLDVDASAEETFQAIDGGFLAPDEFRRQTRTAEAAAAQVALLARLENVNLAQTPEGYEELPLDFSDLNPPAAFWDDAALVEAGNRQVAIAYGDYTFMGSRNYYETRLTNVSRQRVRVKLFASFVPDGAGWRMANFTGEWFSAKDFEEWYGAPAGGWLAPGASVADESNWGGDDAGFWAYWCVNEVGERFVALAHRRPSLAGGAVNMVDGRAQSVSKEPWQPCPAAIRRTIAHHVDLCRKLARDHSNQQIDLDADGVRWLDDYIELQRKQRTPAQWQPLIPVFGAFLGECLVRHTPADWGRYDEILCVVSDGTNATFPFSKVKKQFTNGREEGDSIAGLFASVVALQPKPLTSQQRRFAALFQERRDCQFFVEVKLGHVPAWVRVSAIHEERLTMLELVRDGAAAAKGKLSVRLDQMATFKVTDAAGLRVDLGAGPEAPQRRH